MPRKAIPRAFKLVCKHYKGFDRHFATKAIATRKLHASQGVFVNHKLAATSDAKLSKTPGKPLVRSYSTYPSFAAQPVAAHTRSATRLAAAYQPAAASSGVESQLSAPSFAATPVWQRQSRSEPQAGSCSSSGGDALMAEGSLSSPAALDEGLKADPVYQYAKLGQAQSSDRRLTRQGSLRGKGQERSALKWFGNLDRRPLPIAKVSGPSSKHSPPTEKSRMATAFAAYADLDPRKQ